MSELRDELYYSETHEWLRDEGGTGVIGITDYAQEQLGDIVFVELPKTGKSIKKGEVFGTVESVKSVSELFSPVSGEVTEINNSLSNNPETVNKSPYNEGWMIKIKIKNRDELSSLLKKEAYSKIIV